MSVSSYPDLIPYSSCHIFASNTKKGNTFLPSQKPSPGGDPSGNMSKNYVGKVDHSADGQAHASLSFHTFPEEFFHQGCISCGILVSGIRARGVSSEHMENMEMFSCSPT